MAIHGLLDAALERHGVGAGCDILEALGHDGLGQDGGGGGAVAAFVIGLGGGFLDELGAHILKGIGKLDVLGDGDAVVDDAGRAEFLVQSYGRPLGPSVTLTALVRASMPFFRDLRASSPYLICFAI